MLWKQGFCVKVTQEKRNLLFHRDPTDATCLLPNPPPPPPTPSTHTHKKKNCIHNHCVLFLLGPVIPRRNKLF